MGKTASVAFWAVTSLKSWGAVSDSKGYWRLDIVCFISCGGGFLHVLSEGGGLLKDECRSKTA